MLKSRATGRDFRRSHRFLHPQLIHNGVAHTAVALYKGGHASPVGWNATIGNNLSVVSTGDDPVMVRSPIYGIAPDIPGSVHDNKIYQESTPGTAQIATEDFVIEIVLEYDTWATTSTVQLLAGTRFGGGEHNWDIRRVSETTITLLMEDTSGVVQSASTGVLADNTRYHIMIFADRSGSAYFFVNGVSSGSGVISGNTGSLSNSRAFTIGGAVNLQFKTGSVIDHFAMWLGSGIINPSGSAMLDTAAARFSQLPPLN